MKEIENWLTLDEYGMQMPWYTRPALEVINAWNLNGKTIFEYGAGYSTLWYRSRGAEVFGVDNNEQWAIFAGVSFEFEKDRYLDSINHF